MPGDANLGDDVAVDVSADKDDVGVHVSVGEDDVEVGTKKRRLGTGPEVGHGDALFLPRSEEIQQQQSLIQLGEEIELLNEECEGEEGESGSEESECEEGVCRLCDNHGSNKRPFFMLGMTFSNAEEIKRAINQYAIIEGVKLRILKSEPSRIRVICQEGCPFLFYASKEGDNLGLKVKTLCHEHKCLRVFKNPRASAKWLAEHFKNKIQERPKYKVSDMQKDVEAEFKLHVSIHKCKRAKKLIMEEMKGRCKYESRNLEAYCNESRTSNPVSDVSVEGHNKSTCKDRPPSTSTNTTGKKRGRPKKVNANCSQQSQISQEEQCQPITGRPKLPVKSSYNKKVNANCSQQSQISQEEQCQPITGRPKLPVKSSYKKRAECGMGIRFDLETG